MHTITYVNKCIVANDDEAFIEFYRTKVYSYLLFTIFAPQNENSAKMTKLKTNEVIQQVAGDLFQKFGFEKTSMEEIARKAHKAKRSIYNHFNSKEALFVANVQDELNAIREHLQLIVDDNTQLVLPRLKQYLLLRMELIAQARTLRVAMKDNLYAEDSFRFEDLKEALQNFAQWEHNIFKKVWYAKPTEDTAGAIEQQAVAFADMLQVTLNGLSHTFFTEDKFDQYKNSYEMLINIIVNSVFQSFAKAETLAVGR